MRACLRALFAVALMSSGLFGPPRLRAASAPAPSSGYGGIGASPAGDTVYLFGWGYVPMHAMAPRGGSSEGGPVTLAPGRALPLPEIASAKDAFARDRAAILALAGDFRVSFHELEILGFSPDYQPPRSYNSWATEHVRVVEDTGRIIRLQHTLVMYFKKADGTISGPMLTKHWRQDWTYEKTDLHLWEGGSQWVRHSVPKSAAQGTWTHSVYNLEDSPRYEVMGRWDHRGNVSMWTSERAWRPLPRREYTVRSDYDVLEGVHSVAISPTGWVEERNMFKRATEGGATAEPPRYLAQEIGIDRYERITAPSLSAADEYWKKTAGYWAIVRRVWAEEMAKRHRFTLRDEVDGKISYQFHNEAIQKLEAGETFDPAKAEQQIRKTIAQFIVDQR